MKFKEEIRGGAYDRMIFASIMSNRIFFLHFFQFDLGSKLLVLPIFWRVLLMQRHFSLMQVRQCFLLLQTPCDVDVTNCSSQVVWMYPHRTTETPGLALSGKTRKEKRCSSIYKHKSYLSMI
ncbi:uncharacterized protein LOC107842771 isoform X1 [Capsicum annuum]|uniref:uncharacterized protein LOC107842771 isoform X1 n=1 Tax=Capsicum annuum TaxID=4072 RepID=UPI001FB04DFD|nr:uncharacterized protein LOC107842771 isoform X1 [Capsicum annuum]